MARVPRRGDRCRRDRGRYVGAGGDDGAKEAVNRAFETTLAEGMRFERRLFHAVFANQDQKEGVTAFVDKRPPEFAHR
jgi:hypothetical protein